MPLSDNAVLRNIAAIHARMQQAQSSMIAARQAELIAVSKGQPFSRLELALEAGQREFGENRVQEAAEKWPQLRAQYSGITLHLIGPLQTNKVKQAVALFDVIHTLDREKLARELAQEMMRSGRNLSCFVQVNTGEEAQKGGISPAETAEFVRFCRDQLKLLITGLMCIPPVGDHPAPHFGLLRKLAQPLGLSNLSMGMSGDFETAVRFGATHIRVGTAIFGERDIS